MNGGHNGYCRLAQDKSYIKATLMCSLGACYKQTKIRCQALYIPQEPVICCDREKIFRLPHGSGLGAGRDSYLTWQEQSGAKKRELGGGS